MGQHGDDTEISKNGISGEYDDMFDASEVSNMACEEIVDYHKSLLRMEEMDEIWEEGMKEGMEKGMELHTASQG